MKRYGNSFVLAGCMLVASIVDVTNQNAVAAFSIVPTATRTRSTQLVGSNGAGSSSTELSCSALVGTDVALGVARNVQPSVALVTPKGVRNMTARGSGFVIDFEESSLDGATATTATESKFTYLVTAAHVAAPGYDIDISFLDTNGTIATCSATVVARNQTLDLALLRTQLPSTQPRRQGLTLASYSKKLPEVGTLAFAHGYPASRLRGGPAMTSGIVCGVADGLGVPESMSSPSYRRRGDNDNNNNNEQITVDETVFVVTDAAMSGGMSGGPLVDVHGHVLGVNALIRPDLRALGNYAVSAQELSTFLETVLSSLRLLEEPLDGTASRNSTSSKSTSSSHRVWLFNDPMNKKERVSDVLTRVALLDNVTADQVMMEAHTTGRGMVGNWTQASQANDMWQALRKEDLLVEVEQV